jgi:hypothetical protein
MGKLIGVMGLIGSGKGAMAEYLMQTKGFKRLSFADPVKDAAAGMFGWNRTMLQGDTEESRKWREEKDVFWSNVLERPFSPRIALQEIGTEVGRNYFHPDIWLKNLEKKILDDAGKSDFVIDDCRFPNEIELIQRMGGKTFIIERGQQPEWWSTALRQNSDEMGPDDSTMEKKYRSIHPSEWKWISKRIYQTSVRIPNNGTLEEFQQKVDSALQDA